MNRLMRYLAPIAAATMLVSCGAKESYDASEVQAKAFHDALGTGSYEGIWQNAAPEFRRDTDKAKFDDLMKAIEGQLGKVTATSRTNWQANNNNGVSTVTMTYNTTFERGSATETLTYLWVNDKTLALLNYTIKPNEPAAQPAEPAK